MISAIIYVHCWPPAPSTNPNKNHQKINNEYVSIYVLRFFVMLSYNVGWKGIRGSRNLSKRTDNNNENVRHWGRFVLPLGKAPMQNELLLTVFYRVRSRGRYPIFWTATRTKKGAYPSWPDGRFRGEVGKWRLELHIHREYTVTMPSLPLSYSPW